MIGIRSMYSPNTDRPGYIIAEGGSPAHGIFDKRTMQAQGIGDRGIRKTHPLKPVSRYNLKIVVRSGQGRIQEERIGHEERG
jgi:hypothetical protein